MATLSAPQDGDGVRIGFGIHDGGAADENALTRIKRAGVIYDEDDPSGAIAVADLEAPAAAAIAASTSGNNTIVAAQGASTYIRVWQYVIVAEGDVDVRWEDGADGTALSGQMHMTADGEGISATAGGLVPLFTCAANTLLNMELSGAVAVNGHISYTVVSDLT